MQAGQVPPVSGPANNKRQQQAEAKRVKIRVDSRHAREEVAPSARCHGGKRLTTYQERVLSEAYGDYVRQRQKEKEENEAWESRLLRSLQSEERERSASVTSEELKQVLGQVDSVNGSKQAHGAAKASEPAHQDQDDDVRQRAPKIHQSLAETPKVDRAATSTHTVQTSGDTALAEALNQLDEEDELASNGDTDDLDYVDEEENVDEEEKTSDVESEHDDSFEDAVCIKRKPKIHRTQPKKSTDALSRAPDTSEVEAPAAGSFLEGFPIFWPSWKAFDDVFADFQQQTFQLFSYRTSTSIKARNKAIHEEQKKAKKPAKKMKGKRPSKHRRTGGTLLPEAWKCTAERSCVRTPCRLRGREPGNVSTQLFDRRGVLHV
ncbi:hypothetical protein PF005_g14506 [Phytophthora fragariae]|uniref:Uncharacterized protein n=3 Tax=Phytophthora fragariae TaxID=53985 RepID=A0A6A3XIN5_9STRA|nr:hypothetical protein PF011_g13531 [Phytophthora fragariae]KAE9202610.1 hypothetical protein PF005_g14506 [Phytophthora fragariae]